jgi:hypothetical protein
MIPQDKVIYTDGRDVTVTYSTLKVRKHEYIIRGITKHGLMILKPHRWPGLLLVAMGVVMAVFGILRIVPALGMQGAYINDAFVSSNTIALWTGLAVALIGILIVGLMRERYAVRIATAEGEKDAVVSHKKEYIAQIVDALNQAGSFVNAKAATQPDYRIRPA